MYFVEIRYNNDIDLKYFKTYKMAFKFCKSIKNSLFSEISLYDLNYKLILNWR